MAERSGAATNTYVIATIQDAIRQNCSTVTPEEARRAAEAAAEALEKARREGREIF